MLLFLGIVLLLFQSLYALAKPVQDLLGSWLDWLQTVLLEPGLTAIGAPDFLRGFLVDGVWLGVGTVTTFLPVIFLFYLVLAVIEDSGYLPRAAFLMDGFMNWFGLDGRAFVLQVMGFGCNVPSILGTRVIRDPAQRLLTMLVIPFALCQARLTVFVFMAGVFFPRPWWAAGLVVFGFYLMSFIAAIITGLVFKRVFPSREAFVLELPPTEIQVYTQFCDGPGVQWLIFWPPLGCSSCWERQQYGCSPTCLLGQFRALAAQLPMELASSSSLYWLQLV